MSLNQSPTRVFNFFDELFHTREFGFGNILPEEQHSFNCGLSSTLDLTINFLMRWEATLNESSTDALASLKRLQLERPLVQNQWLLRLVLKWAICEWLHRSCCGLFTKSFNHGRLLPLHNFQPRLIPSTVSTAQWLWPCWTFNAPFALLNFSHCWSIHCSRLNSHLGWHAVNTHAPSTSNVAQSRFVWNHHAWADWRVSDQQDTDYSRRPLEVAILTAVYSGPRIKNFWAFGLPAQFAINF